MAKTPTTFPEPSWCSLRGGLDWLLYGLRPVNPATEAVMRGPPEWPDTESTRKAKVLLIDALNDGRIGHFSLKVDNRRKEWFMSPAPPEDTFQLTSFDFPEEIDFSRSFHNGWRHSGGPVPHIFISIADLMRASVEWALPTTPVQSKRATTHDFYSPRWNLAQLVAWAWYRSQKLVSEVGDVAEGRGHLLSVGASAFRLGLSEVCDFQMEVEPAIYEALRRGQLRAFGCENGGSNLSPMHVLNWDLLRICFDTGGTLAKSDGRPIWTNLRFSSGQALTIWPPRGYTASSAASMQEKQAGSKGYSSRWIRLSQALEQVAAIVGPNDAWPQVRTAVSDCALAARGLLDGQPGTLHGEWLLVLCWDEPSGDILWFDREKGRRLSNPPPFRAERIEVDWQRVAELWPRKPSVEAPDGVILQEEPQAVERAALSPPEPALLEQSAWSAPTRQRTEKDYAEWIARIRIERDRRPTIVEDEEWRQSKGISRARLREMRAVHRKDGEEKGGRRKHPLTTPPKLCQN